eukprot:scaffold1313_cov250-Pinguiococcus_pyrenoidosus.AAC.3
MPLDAVAVKLTPLFFDTILPKAPLLEELGNLADPTLHLFLFAALGLLDERAAQFPQRQLLDLTHELV